MPYSVEIYSLDGTPVYYDAFEEQHVPDQIIREVRIDDARIDPVDLFTTVGRKCMVVLSMDGTFGWITNRGYSSESHPKYKAWFPFVFVVKRDDTLLFIGALKKSNYEIDQQEGIEKLRLSDATDIWISIVKDTQDRSYTTSDVWTADITMSRGLRILDDWGSMLSTRAVSSNLPLYHMFSDINLSYPGYSGGDFAYLWLEYGGQQLFQKHRVAHLVSGTHSDGSAYHYIYISFFISYWHAHYMHFRGFVMVLDALNPFMLSNQVLQAAQDAANGEGISFYFRNSSTIAAIQEMRQRRILPPDYSDDNNYDLVEYGDTRVAIVADHAYTVSGRYYPQTQHMVPNVTNYDAVKAMLVCNMAILESRPYSSWMGEYYTKTLMRNVLTLQDYSGQPYAKYFTAREMTHYKKTAAMIDSNMFEALSALTNGDSLKNLLPALYDSILGTFRYLVTFSAHSSVSGVQSLEIGSLIATANTMGDLIIIAKSDEDQNGLITFTAAGGY